MPDTHSLIQSIVANGQELAKREAASERASLDAATELNNKRRAAAIRWREFKPAFAKMIEEVNTAIAASGFRLALPHVGSPDSKDAKGARGVIEVALARGTGAPGRLMVEFKIGDAGNVTIGERVPKVLKDLDQPLDIVESPMEAFRDYVLVFADLAIRLSLGK